MHSQNFIDIREGVLTNNRRIVTKNMWFNGTAMSAKARRALENEKVTIVSHISGYIHHIYPKATISKTSYDLFSVHLRDFLRTNISAVNFINFLRYHMTFKKCFQYKHCIKSRYYYIALETIFEYEHHSKYNFAEGSREALLEEIEDEEFSLAPLDNRIEIQEVEEYLEKNPNKDLETIMEYFISRAKSSNCNNEDNLRRLFMEFNSFLTVEPKLPAVNKQFIPSDTLPLNPDNSREEIIELVQHYANSNEVAMLSLYAFRQMDLIDWQPFVKASIERNPVSVEGLMGKTASEAYGLILSLVNESIYDGKRLAQPDETWNFWQGRRSGKGFCTGQLPYKRT
ncbi:MAG: hypothetical protein HC830_05260 [Bacteroidetes bacterium]|nr:hypothetical protein [Bacteroidota bacterium]